ASIDRRLSVAPMMDWTDRHCRYFLRGYSPRALLYTEMITAAAIVHGDRERLLRYSVAERPLALQLGGSDPQLLAAAARAGAQSGYDEINLNCGCPSERVHTGAFGACLMRTPGRVAECVAAMRAAVAVPVSVKLRIGLAMGPDARAQIGVFDEPDYERLRAFISTVSGSGCRHFIVHARKAVLGGLSPRENREVPPLRFDVVRRLKQDFPLLWIAVNGGLRTPAQSSAALSWCDAVMLGREVYHRPALLAQLHAQVYNDGWQCPDPATMLERMTSYAEREVAGGEPLSAITRHMLGMYAGQPGARRFRQWLSEGARSLGTGAGAVAQICALMRKAAAACEYADA
ncbi:MAG: tRNA dihydrouridine(20/20a) synthase DusA, partial [Steroidobacteraceae bacterium]